MTSIHRQNFLLSSSVSIKLKNFYSSIISPNQFIPLCHQQIRHLSFRSINSTSRVNTSARIISETNNNTHHHHNPQTTLNSRQYSRQSFSTSSLIPPSSPKILPPFPQSKKPLPSSKSVPKSSALPTHLPPDVPRVEIEIPSIAELSYIRGMFCLSVMTVAIVFAKIRPADGYNSLIQIAQLIEYQHRHSTFSQQRFGLKPQSAPNAPAVTFTSIDYPMIDFTAPNYRQYYSLSTLYLRAISSLSQIAALYFPSTFTPRFYLHPFVKHLGLYDPNNAVPKVTEVGNVCVISGDSERIDEDLINIQQFCLHSLFIVSQYIYYINSTLDQLEVSQKSTLQYYIDRATARFTDNNNTFFASKTHAPLNQYYSYKPTINSSMYSKFESIVQQYNKLLYDMESTFGMTPEQLNTRTEINQDKFSPTSSPILTHPGHIQFDHAQIESVRNILYGVINQNLFTISKIIDLDGNLKMSSFLDKHAFLYGQGLRSIAEITSARYTIEGMFIQLNNYKLLMKCCENDLWVQQNLALNPLKRQAILNYIASLPTNATLDDIFNDDIQRLCDQFGILSIPENMGEMIFGNNSSSFSLFSKESPNEIITNIQERIETKTEELLHLYTLEYKQNNKQQLELLSDEKFIQNQLKLQQKQYKKQQHRHQLDESDNVDILNELQKDLFYALKIKREPINISLLQTYPQYFPSSNKKIPGFLASFDDLQANPQFNNAASVNPTLIDFSSLQTTPPADWGQYTYLSIPSYVPSQQRKLYYSVYGPNSTLNWLSSSSLPKYAYGALLLHIASLFDKIDFQKLKKRQRHQQHQIRSTQFAPSSSSLRPSQYSSFIQNEPSETLPLHPTYIPSRQQQHY